jgi:hypothetical protein
MEEKMFERLKQAVTFVLGCFMMGGLLSCGDNASPELPRDSIETRAEAVEDSLAKVFRARRAWQHDLPRDAWPHTYTLYFQRALVLSHQPTIHTGDLLDIRLQNEGYHVLLEVSLDVSYVPMYLDLQCSSVDAEALLSEAARNDSSYAWSSVSVATEITEVARPQLTFEGVVEADDPPYAIIEPTSTDFVIGKGRLLGFGIIRDVPSNGKD